jgi:carbon storage regulator
MLVLTRKRLETVVFGMPDGRRITVSVQDLKGDKVRLGFNADADISIHRGEVQELVDAGVGPNLKKGGS